MLAPESTALAFARACDAAGVPYVVVGGLAVGAWGIPRATQDVDVIVHLERERIHTFARTLQAEGLTADVRDLEDALRDRSHVTIVDPRTQYHVDLKPASSDEERRQAREAVGIHLEGGILRISSPEDTIAYKILYGSPQDLADARSILVRQEGRLDLARLRGIADRLGVGSQLRDLMERT